MRNWIKKNNIINLLLIVFYAIFTLVLVLHHEIWADEAQAWLVVRDLDFLGIIRHVRTEGHPLVWYFLLFPFAKLHLPVISMQIVNWILTVLGAGIFLFKSPFKFYTKAAVLLSSGFLYWLPAMARSYCLIPVFLFGLAILYKKQKEHPYWYAGLLILLANTHVIMFGFCTALAILFVFENKEKKFIAPACAVFLGLIACAGYLWGSQNENVLVSGYEKTFGFNSLKLFYDTILFNLHGFVFSLTEILFGFFIITASAVLFIQSKKMFFVFISNLIWQGFLFIKIWSIIPQRAYVFLFVCMFCFWTVYKDLRYKKLLNILLSAIFLFSLPNAYDLIKKEFSFYFSDGKNAAEFIQKNIPKDAFVITNYPITTAISAYLPKNKWGGKIYYEGYKNYFTFTVFNKKIPPSTAPVPVKEKLEKYGEIYVILDYGNFYTDSKPIYTSSSSVFLPQERFNIYKFTQKK